MPKSYEEILTDINAYFDEKVLKCRETQAEFDIEKSRSMCLAYHCTYKDDQYITKAIEEPFDLPIYNIETKQESVHRYCGIVDAVVEKNRKLWFADHKTTGQISPMYWMELRTNPQLTHYLLAARQMGLEVAGFLWDVLVKPKLSPGKAKHFTKKIVKDLEQGQYCGFDYHEWDGVKVETPKMYGLRCLGKMIDNPSKYFERRLIPRSDKELLEYNKELYTVAEEMKRAKNDVSLTYRNLKSCTKYNSMCEYHELCSGQEDLDNTHLYQIKVDSEPKERKTPVDSISTSRVESYQTCHRKWDLKYNQRIEKNLSTYQGNLDIGSMVHSALEIILRERMDSTPISFKSLCS